MNKILICRSQKTFVLQDEIIITDCAIKSVSYSVFFSSFANKPLMKLSL